MMEKRTGKDFFLVFPEKIIIFPLYILFIFHFMKPLRYLSIFALFVSSFSFAHANLSISPLKHEITIEAGAEKSEIIKVTNNGDAPITLYSSKEDFIAGDDTGTPTFVKPQQQTSDEYSLSNWISIENENLTLGKGETREVRFTVKVPPKGEP